MEKMVWAEHSKWPLAEISSLTQLDLLLELKEAFAAAILGVQTLTFKCQHLLPCPKSPKNYTKEEKT